MVTTLARKNPPAPSSAGQSRSLWGSRGQRELSCAGELGSTDFYHEFRSILAQIFCVALIPLQIYVQGRSSTNVIMPNDEWKCLGNLPAIINELHHARDRRRYIVFCPVLSIECTRSLREAASENRRPVGLILSIPGPDARSVLVG